ncbi:MAG: FAD:protein FMN transferase [Planctomycetota bacterium]
MTARNRRKLWKNLWNKPVEWSPVLQSSGRSRTEEFTWLVASRQAMGTFFELRMASHTLGALALAERCFDLVDELEIQMTIYRDDSTIARLNQSYHNQPISLEPKLYELLKLARTIHSSTGGAYDITTGALSRAWGFVQGPKRVPSDLELKSAMARTGLRHLIFNDLDRSIQSTDPGIEINLGSIGKGYAIDRVADLFKNHPFPAPALIHGGRSSLYALGHQPGTLFEPWSIALHNPLDPNQPLIQIKLQDQALGTSGGTFQSFEQNGRSYGHIIDPRSGIPAPGPLSVTVIAPTAAEADALSTAFYRTGPKIAQQIIDQNPSLSAIFLTANPSTQPPAPELLLLNISPEKVVIGNLRSTFIQPGQPLPQ